MACSEERQYEQRLRVPIKKVMALIHTFYEFFDGAGMAGEGAKRRFKRIDRGAQAGIQTAKSVALLGRVEWPIR
jgi:hypothetical protein